MMDEYADAMGNKSDKTAKGRTNFGVRQVLTNKFLIYKSWFGSN